MAETKTEVKTLGYMVDGEWQRVEERHLDRHHRLQHRRGDRAHADVHRGRGHRGHRVGPPRLRPLGQHADPEAHRGALHLAPDAAREDGRDRHPGLDRARQEPRRGPRRGHQDHRGHRHRRRRPDAHEGREPDERVHRARHRQLPRAARRLRRHRAVQLPGHDPLRLDAAHLHRLRQHLRAQGRQPRAADQPPAARHALRGRPAQGRRQHGDGREGAGRGPAQAPGRPRRLLRRHHAGRQARLLHRRRARQARPGADAGQEPRPRARRRLARARRPRHHQLDLRLRRHALHGAARLRRRERGRRRVRRAT